MTGPGTESVQQLLLSLGRRLCEERRYDEAHDTLLWAVREAASVPVTVRAQLALADVHLAQRQFRSAANVFVDAFGTDRANPGPVLDRIAEVLSTVPADASPDSDHGRMAQLAAEELLSHRERLLSLPGEAGLHAAVLLAEAALRQDDSAAAAEFLRRAATIDAAAAVASARNLNDRVVEPAAESPAAGGFVKARMLAGAGADADALAMVDEVLGREREDGLPSSFLAPVHDLRAVLLDRTGRTDDAIRARYEAGREWYWAGKMDRALTAFDLVRAAGAGGPDLPFFRAHCMWATPCPPADQYTDHVRAALKAWSEAGAEVEPPAWAFELRGDILLDLAAFDENPRAVNWEAAIEFERALAREERPSGMAGLATAYWELDCQAVALRCVVDAWERSQSEYVLGKTVRILLNAGQPAPESLVEAVRRQAADDPWYRAVSGVLHWQAGDPAVADDELARALSTDPGLLWAYWYRLHVLIQLRRWDEVATVLEAVEQESEPTPHSDYALAALAHARARLLRGHPEDVAGQEESLMRLAGSAGGDVEWLLAIASAYLGDIDGYGRWAERAHTRVVSLGAEQLREAALDLTLAAAILEHDRGPDGEPAVDRLRQESANLNAEAVGRGQEFGADVAIGELASITDAAPAGTASRLMLARILLDEGRSQEAAPVLEALDSEPDRTVFAEAPDVAAAGYATAALGAARQHRPLDVATYLGNSVQSAIKAGRDDLTKPIRALADTGHAGQLADAPALVALSQGFTSLLGVEAWSSSERLNLSAALLRIHRTAYPRVFGPLTSGDGTGDESPMTRLLVAPPILIEADPGLFPDGGDTPAVRWMLDEGIPEMKKRLGHPLVPLPGVRIRPVAELRDRAYRLVVLYSLVAPGTVPEEPDGFAAVLRHLEATLRPRRSRLLDRAQFIEGLNASAEQTGSDRPAAARIEAALAVARAVLQLGGEPIDPDEIAGRIDPGVGLVPNLAAVAHPVATGPAAFVLDAGIEASLAEGLTGAGDDPAVVLPAGTVADLENRFRDWHCALPHAGDPAAGTVLVRDPNLLLATHVLAARAGLRCGVAPLAVEGRP
ncbi:tetratricopeptide repeat protein [Paractinoplanes globisporus]|uniref:Tetratricopeptide repeat protein n=1 Tax=Paractinoplanes globisporus TaxID=113565 RepID=A0ABW6W741_9ACTN|nr:hypothetical protein [Actinoplanes globisporus]